MLIILSFNYGGLISALTFVTVYNYGAISALTFVTVHNYGVISALFCFPIRFLIRIDAHLAPERLAHFYCFLIRFLLRIDTDLAPERP